LRSDTIAAVASPPGVGAIALIRMSGPASIIICDQVFKGRTRPTEAGDRTVILGEIIARDGSAIDQVLVTVMRGPRSMTGEDVVEITCHGGILAPRLVLRRLLEHGASPAEPGEFTKRAFMNGKMDLTQAEAVSELVHAGSEKALKVAVRQLRGELGKHLEVLERSLLDWLALIEANIDFADEEVDRLDPDDLAVNLEHVGSSLEDLLAGYEQGKYVKHGLDITIVGRPNVGKSSLFNRLIGQDRVIVSETPGTTRDVIDGLVSVNGMMLRVHDTAGLGAACGPIEAEAVRRTQRHADEADIVLVVLDVSRSLSDKDVGIVNGLGGKPHLVVANKTDLPQQADLSRLAGPVMISALKGWGMPDLLERIKQVAHARLGDLEYEIVIGERHVRCIREALDAILRARQGIVDAIPIEFLASDLRCALDSLGEVTGRKVASGVLDEIFSRFCIGK
jgi:tRNA modification GTPase